MRGGIGIDGLLAKGQSLRKALGGSHPVQSLSALCSQTLRRFAHTLSIASLFLRSTPSLQTIPRARRSSWTARWAASMAVLVNAAASESELAMAIRPQGRRPTT